MSLFLTGGRCSLTPSPVPGPRGHIMPVLGWGRWWQGVVYRWLHHVRGKSSGSGSVSWLPPARGEQPVKIYKYRVLYFILLFSWWVSFIRFLEVLLSTLAGVDGADVFLPLSIGENITHMASVSPGRVAVSRALPPLQSLPGTDFFSFFSLLLALELPSLLQGKAGA